MLLSLTRCFVQMVIVLNPLVLRENTSRHRLGQRGQHILLRLFVSANQPFVELGQAFREAFFNFIPSPTIIFLPIVVGLLLVLTLGLSYILSIIHVFVKDIQIVWGILVHALFFVTPVLWYLEDADDFLLSIHRFNPVGLISELGHEIVVFRQVPPLNDWLYAATFSFIIFFVGYVIFQKYESKIVEVL